MSTSNHTPGFKRSSTSQPSVVVGGGISGLGAQLWHGIPFGTVSIVSCMVYNKRWRLLSHFHPVLRGRHETPAGMPGRTRRFFFKSELPTNATQAPLPLHSWFLWMKRVQHVDFAHVAPLTPHDGLQSSSEMRYFNRPCHLGGTILTLTSQTSDPDNCRRRNGICVRVCGLVVINRNCTASRPPKGCMSESFLEASPISYSVATKRGNGDDEPPIG